MMKKQAEYSDVRYEGLPPLFPRRSDFWHIPKCCPGGTVYILGGGSSFDPSLAESLADKYVIGCNESYRLRSRIVNHCHFTDLRWWLEHQDDLGSYDGSVSTCQRMVLDPRIHILQSRPMGIVFDDDSKIGVNRNTGLGAMNIAIHMGAKRIILLGFDMHRAQSPRHWYARKEKGSPAATFRMHRRFALEVWEDIEAHGGIEVINASSDSSLPYWPKKQPKEVL